MPTLYEGPARLYFPDHFPAEEKLAAKLKRLRIPGARLVRMLEECQSARTSSTYYLPQHAVYVGDELRGLIRVQRRGTLEWWPYAREARLLTLSDAAAAEAWRQWKEHAARLAAHRAACAAACEAEFTP